MGYGLRPFNSPSLQSLSPFFIQQPLINKNLSVRMSLSFVASRLYYAGYFFVQKKFLKIFNIALDKINTIGYF
jgi:hypothetical protein